MLTLLVLLAILLPQTAHATPAEVDAVNQVRLSHGLKPFVNNQQLTNSATAKARDHCEKNYWSHGDWYRFITASGYQYKKSGENLVYGAIDTPVTIRAWLNSPAHYELMVDDYVDAGMATITCPTFQGAYTVRITVLHVGTPRNTIKPATEAQPTSQPTGIVASAKETIEKPTNRLYALLIGALAPLGYVIYKGTK